MDEDRIVQGCLRNEASAQRALYERFAGQMMSVCLRYSNSKEEAEDVMQEGFIKVFEKFGQYSGKGSIAGWIRTIMVNTALVDLRKNKRWQYKEEITEESNFSNEEFSALDHMAADELMELINSMPPGYKTVFNLFAIEGYAHKEIAEMLGITESTSKTQFRKAKAYIRKKLERIQEEH